MLKKEKKSYNEGGQTFIEYTLVIGMVIVILLAMSPMIKRVVQGMVKLTADQIGLQNEGDQHGFYNGQFQGYMENQYTQARASRDKLTKEFLGVTRYTYADLVATNTTQHSNLGFTRVPGSEGRKKPTSQFSTPAQIPLMSEGQYMY